MPQVKRRHFLQMAGATLATLGLNTWDIQRAGDRYAHVLAQETPRKLALLVGINAYSQSPLNGCVMDVELQRELLIHRYGFQPQDILTVLDAQATRTGILTAFEEHLIKQAKPGDVVVFHFSGHGDRVLDPDSGFADRLNSTMVPVDRTESVTGGQVAINDIMGASLYLLMSAVQTENLTVVLDSCHSGGGKRGNLTVRAYGGTRTGVTPRPNAQERDYQQQWLARLNRTAAEFRQGRQTAVAKGAVIASARRDQLAADMAFHGFYAGAFTYYLTQYLWQATGNEGLNAVMARVTQGTSRLSSIEQIPEFEVQTSPNLPFYFLQPQILPAEAVVTQSQGDDQVELWLGGISPNALHGFNPGALFNAIDATGQPQGEVQLTSREGLRGVGTVLSSTRALTPQAGMLLQEKLRVIPVEVALRIGLDDSLQTEQQAARQALQAIPRVEALSLGQGAVDYILGRVTPTLQQTMQIPQGTPAPALNSVGLYGQGLDLLPGSFGPAVEPIADAIARLQPRFRGLLAIKLLKTTLNFSSSQLNVSANLILPDQNQMIAASQFTPRSGSQGSAPTVPRSRVSATGIVQLPVGTRFQLQLNNTSPRDLHALAFVINTQGDLSLLFPYVWDVPEDQTLIPKGESIMVPLRVVEPLGTAELLVIMRPDPLNEVLKTLRVLANQNNMTRGFLNISQDPLEPMASLFEDFDRGSRGPGGITSTANPNYRWVEPDTTHRAVDMANIAALSIVFEAIAS